MSWLARIEIDSGTALANGIVGSYHWHRRLWECLPDDPDHRRDFLTRIDELESSFRVWLLSIREPACPYWCPHDGFQAKKIAPSFLNHRFYAFDLRANPTKAVVVRGSNGEAPRCPNGKLKRGKRIAITDAEELAKWLQRKGHTRGRNPKTGKELPGGFRIVEKEHLEIGPAIEYPFRKLEHAAYHGGVQFRGVLEITDLDAFVETYHDGIGSGKAFGFGLLLLSPI